MMGAFFIASSTFTISPIFRRRSGLGENWLNLRTSFWALAQRFPGRPGEAKGAFQLWAGLRASNSPCKTRGNRARGASRARHYASTRVPENLQSTKQKVSTGHGQKSAAGESQSLCRGDAAWT